MCGQKLPPLCVSLLAHAYTLFTHVQSCSSTASIFVEILRSFPFFLRVSILATILLVAFALETSGASAEFH
jgi:hypothetical protein